MTYTNRTCNKCGIRKPQPEMQKVEVYDEVGKSKPGVSGATFLGTALGDKKSADSVNRWIFNTNQRTYKRKRTVWSCAPCANKEKRENTIAENLGMLLLIIIGAVLFLIFNSL